MELLRFATAGSVDDGKSTLIGRLLHDTKALFDDQIDAVAASTARRGGEGLDLALVTDGLRAEREQGITIDVAYRYFSTPMRSFVIADTPGHVQYTRNMVTGASTSDLAVILVDARHGLREQSRRHACLSALLGIRHLVLAVNKMDLVGWDKSVYNDITDEFTGLARGLGVDDFVSIPMCALDGGNVVEPAEQTPWYDGPTLLEHLELVPISGVQEPEGGLRLPIQWVVRPALGTGERRWYAGSLAAGTVSPGDEVVVLPGNVRTRIAAVEGNGLALRVQLTDEVDVGRGDVLAAADDPATVVDEITATVAWLNDRPLRAGGRYLIKHTARIARAAVVELVDKLDVTSLERLPSQEELNMNEIGTVRLRSASPLVVDPYRHNRTMGSFVIIDEVSNATVGAGMVLA